MWEYKRTELKFRTYAELNEELRRLGTDGWEIIYYKENEFEKKNNILINVLIKRYVNDNNSSS